MLSNKCDKCKKDFEFLYGHKPYLGNEKYYCKDCYKKIYKQEVDFEETKERLKQCNE